MTGASNGTRPPWHDIDPQIVLADLAQQIAVQAAEMAAMRAYINQLTHALAVATAPPNGTVGSANPEPKDTYGRP